MAIDKYKNIDNSDLDRTVWRYLTFPKYISLITYGALWFSKLNILADEFEGFMTTKTDAEMRAQQEITEQTLHPSLREIFSKTNERNVEDGRELTVVNCWFLDDRESEQMWTEYAKNQEGVAIKSTVRLLAQSVFCDSRYSQIGKVQYVDLETHAMSPYEATQAQERAFLKKLEFSHEQELRIASLNVRGPMCVSLEGDQLTPNEWQGVGMNNFGNDGLYIIADLSRLIKATILAPYASIWHERLVKKIVRLTNSNAPVERSSLEK